MLVQGACPECADLATTVCVQRNCSMACCMHTDSLLTVAAPSGLPACLQTGATTLYYPKPLASVYGTGTVWAFGGTWLT